jgi:endonuclease-3
VSWQPPDPGTVRLAHRRLARRLGPLHPPVRRDPVEELVLTVLSQNTSDVNRDRAFSALRDRFPTWDALAAARVEDVAEAIKPGGLSQIKAPRILAILREIRHRDGSLDLAWMRTAPDDDVASYLVSLPGVGPKTAACVLAFSLERPVIPVDTHVHRVAGRLGWIPPRTGADRAHELLAEVVPPGLRVSMHVGLIRLGREVCKPARPRCEDCLLNDMCPTAPVYLAGRSAGADRPPRAASRRGPGPR